MSGERLTERHLLVRVRPIRPEECALVGELCVAAYRAGGHLADDDPYATTLRDVTTRAAHAEVLVAEQDDELLGTVTICPMGSPYAEIGQAGELEFRFLAVSPESWGRGVGACLVEACEQRAVTRGMTALVLCVLDVNEAAHRMYVRLGFSRAPHRDWSRRDGGGGLIAYARPVPSVRAGSR